MKMISCLNKNKKEVKRKVGELYKSEIQLHERIKSHKM